MEVRASSTGAPRIGLVWRRRAKQICAASPTDAFRPGGSYRLNKALDPGCQALRLRLPIGDAAVVHLVWSYACFGKIPAHRIKREIGIGRRADDRAADGERTTGVQGECDLKIGHQRKRAFPVENSGLPRRVTPALKLESGVHRPVFDLARAQRRTGRTLAARSFPALADDSRARSAAGRHGTVRISV